MELEEKYRQESEDRKKRLREMEREIQDLKRKQCNKCKEDATKILIKL